MQTRTETNNTYHVSTMFDGDLTSVTVYHLPTGTRANGHSKRHPEDYYNQKVGYYLAYYRALSRLSNKLTKSILKFTEEIPDGI